MGGRDEHGGRGVSPKVLSRVAAALVATGSLVPIFRHILAEFSFGGLPDVWLWTQGEGVAPGLHCVEVKAPNDSLSDSQRAWHHVLLSAGVSVEVCHVKQVQRTGARANATEVVDDTEIVLEEDETIIRQTQEGSVPVELEIAASGGELGQARPEVLFCD